ncbi:MAG: NAD(P)H-dependent oxidoreductase [Pseudomonadota bacterium]|jgi:putative NADPH-quinone reductase
MRILIILGHPDSETYCGALEQAYARGADMSGAEVRRLNLGELDFDPLLHHGYKEIQTLEPDLVYAQEAIRWAEHLVIIYPTWWGDMPAVMKGFFDRILLPGFAFKMISAWRWRKLLKGRSARLIVTMDTPPLLHGLLYGSPGIRLVKDAILGFCGVSPVRVSTFGPVRHSTEERRARWLAEVEALGRRQR